MIQIDERVARCMTTLKSPEMAPLMDYLKAYRTDVLESLVIAQNDMVIHRAQGKAEFLKELIGHIEKSHDLLRKTRS